ncbi:helix-turn-helix domain-containing protein [Hyphomicrobiales bacterium]|uniref:helix-turn-helix domain-containing protein n=1 Tax=Ensifer sp. R-19 TaxID=3404055 RepID=UPI000DDD4AC9
MQHKPRPRPDANDHVIAYRVHQLRTLGHLSPTDYVRLRSLELRIPSKVMLGPSRRQAITRQRQQIMWELRQQRRMSLPAIARVFSRDHKTVFYALRKIEMENAQ